MCVRLGKGKRKKQALKKLKKSFNPIDNTNKKVYNKGVRLGKREKISLKKLKRFTKNLLDKPNKT